MINTHACVGRSLIVLGTSYRGFIGFASLIFRRKVLSSKPNTSNTKGCPLSVFVISKLT